MLPGTCDIALKLLSNPSIELLTTHVDASGENDLLAVGDRNLGGSPAEVNV